MKVPFKYLLNQAYNSDQFYPNNAESLKLNLGSLKMIVLWIESGSAICEAAVEVTAYRQQMYKNFAKNTIWITCCS